MELSAERIVELYDRDGTRLFSLARARSSSDAAASLAVEAAFARLIRLAPHLIPDADLRRLLALIVYAATAPVEGHSSIPGAVASPRAGSPAGVATRFG